MSALSLLSAVVDLSFAYYVIPRMYNLPLKTIATFHITEIAIVLLGYRLIMKTCKTEKLKNHFYQRQFVDLAILASAVYIAWHRTSLTNNPMPANAALLICCFSYLIYLVLNVIAKYLNIKIGSVWEQHA